MLIELYNTTMNTEQIGKNLLKARKKLGLRQAQVAEKGRG
jgi:hypothetical protein